MLEASNTHARVIIIDEMNLRRACLARMLEGWAADNELLISEAGSASELDELDGHDTTALIVFNVGSTSLGNDQNRHHLARLSGLQDRGKLVIVSDIATCAEAAMALQAGADGFIHSSLDPSLVLEAFAFILHGGSYYPPETVAQGLSQESGPAAMLHGLCAANAEDGTNYPPLTEKQAQVMQEVCKGAPNKLIARMLDMSEATVKVHVRQVMLKLGVSNRTQIAVLAMKHGLFGSEAANKRELMGS